MKYLLAILTMYCAIPALAGSAIDRIQGTWASDCGLKIGGESSGHTYENTLVIQGIRAKYVSRYHAQNACFDEGYLMNSMEGEIESIQELTDDPTLLSIIYRKATGQEKFYAQTFRVLREGKILTVAPKVFSSIQEIKDSIIRDIDLASLSGGELVRGNIPRYLTLRRGSYERSGSSNPELCDQEAWGVDFHYDYRYRPIVHVDQFRPSDEKNCLRFRFPNCIFEQSSDYPHCSASETNGFRSYDLTILSANSYSIQRRGSAEAPTLYRLKE